MYKVISRTTTSLLEKLRFWPIIMTGSQLNVSVSQHHVQICGVEECALRTSHFCQELDWPYLDKKRRKKSKTLFASGREILCPKVGDQQMAFGVSYRNRKQKTENWSHRSFLRQERTILPAYVAIYKHQYPSPA